MEFYDDILVITHTWANSRDPDLISRQPNTNLKLEPNPKVVAITNPFKITF